MRLACDLNQTEATTANWFQPGIVAERGNVDARGFRRVQNRETIGKFMILSIDGYVNHFEKPGETIRSDRPGETINRE